MHCGWLCARSERLHILQQLVWMQVLNVAPTDQAPAGVLHIDYDTAGVRSVAIARLPRSDKHTERYRNPSLCSPGRERSRVRTCRRISVHFESLVCTCVYRFSGRPANAGTRTQIHSCHLQECSEGAASRCGWECCFVRGTVPDRECAGAAASASPDGLQAWCLSLSLSAVLASVSQQFPRRPLLQRSCTPVRTKPRGLDS